MTNKEPIWTKPFISLFSTNFSIFIIFYGLVTVLPLYATDVLERSDEDAGLLMTIFLISAIIMRPFTGKLLDLAGKRKMLWISLFLYLICTVMYYFIEPFSILLILRFVQGIWFSIATTASGSLAADNIPPSRRGAGLGYFTMSTNLAVVVGPFIALTIVQYFSYDIFFIAMSLLLLIGALTALSIPPEKQPAVPPVRAKMTLNDLFEKKSLPIALIGSLVAFSYASILSYLSIYSQQKDLLYLTSSFFAVFAIVMLVSRPFTGRIFDEKGPRYIIIPGLVFFMFGLILLAYMDSPFTFLLSGAFIGLGYGAIVPSFQTLAIQSTTHERSGYATATFFTLFDTGIAIGSFILGIVASKLGYQGLYLLSSGIVALTLIVFLMQMKRLRANLNR
ncbi:MULTISPECIES: MFS transporter [unclassified Psychrobacillus]|uniref:MFS transporter n=1 Tax=unclassified Psychrobacillus TaxID=2636677 RepID=UPI00146A4444|nr:MULTISPECIES: MFS transporter [unclassified Psychrobacillus]MCM3358602.1 MFS transporter [Psychrobacillus sp. MER TA 171]NME05697.1 MFS transporter [Psychrobacillus sp. BL-248-WT-3]